MQRKREGRKREGGRERERGGREEGRVCEQHKVNIRDHYKYNTYYTICCVAYTLEMSTTYTIAPPVSGS